MLNLKKRLSGLILTIALAAALCVPAAAAQNSTQNFTRSKTYAGEFSDVAPGTTFYDNAAALYEYGLSVGKSDGTFGLKDSVTVGQIVIFSGRIHSLYATGDAESGAAGFRKEGQAAYEPYLAYLQTAGVLGTEMDGLYTAPATRAQVAHVLAATLPASALPLVNDSLVTTAYASRQYITDVTEYTDYYDDILTLYNHPRRGCGHADPDGRSRPATDTGVDRDYRACRFRELQRGGYFVGRSHYGGHHLFRRSHHKGADRGGHRLHAFQREQRTGAGLRWSRYLPIRG